MKKLYYNIKYYLQKKQYCKIFKNYVDTNFFNVVKCDIIKKSYFNEILILLHVHIKDDVINIISNEQNKIFIEKLKKHFENNYDIEIFVSDMYTDADIIYIIYLQH